jgi:integrase
MGTVYKESYTKPLPPEAEVFTRKGERFARWQDRRGRRHTGKLTENGDRVTVRASTYTAKYRNGSGLVQKIATGCRTLDAARSVLGDLETRADKVKSGIRTAAEDSVLDHQTTPIDRHITAYLDHLRAKRGKGSKPKVSTRHVANVEHNLKRIVGDCDFKYLRDIGRSAVERWIKRQLEVKKPLSARTINAHLVTLTAFGNWCIESKRLVVNPLARPPKLDEKADRRRQRRALTDDELRRLLHVARLRPLAEYGRETVKLPPDKCKGRKTWTKAPLTHATLAAAAERARETLGERPDFIAGLEHAGRERVLIYKTLVLTGLRKGELASLTVGSLDLTGPTAYATLGAVDDKAGRGADIPLRADLADDLRTWLADRLEAVRAVARASGDPLPVRLPHDAKLLNVPTGLVRILDRDLQAADIPKRDDRGRTVDVHAMRHTFGTHLSKGGVSPRTAQAAMRHSTLDLTMNTYTDPRLLDVVGAMDVLPSLPLGDRPNSDRARATGTAPSFLVPMLVPASGNARADVANADSTDGVGGSLHIAASVAGDVSSDTLTRSGRKRVKGLEPSTFSLGS